MIVSLRAVRLAPLAAAAVCLFATDAEAVAVPSTAATPTAIGSVVAGQAYQVTATGTVDLFRGFNGGAGLTFTADGKPTYPFPSPYTGFNPNGLDYDPTQGTSFKGPGGAGKLMGEFLGSFVSNPTTADYFTIGLAWTFVAPTGATTLYGLVNDVTNGYGDNAGSYSVTLSRVAAAVPAPAALGVFAVALAGLAGAASRARPRPA